MTRNLTIGLVVSALVLGAACKSDDGGDGGSAGAFLACRTFRQMANDYTRGVLTKGEVRKRLKDVDDDAQVADEPAIRAAASRVLAAATPSIDNPDFAPAVLAMGRACDAVGG